jgi:hypothetical protein
MPLCGFNKKMLEGLVAFHEGLVEHGLIDRAEIKDQSVEKTLEIELSDMERFLGETYRINDSQKRAITEAITNYAKAFYEIVESQGVNNYKPAVQRLNEFYRKMDDKFYSELEGKPDDMKQLAIYLDSKNI